MTHITNSKSLVKYDSFSHPGSQIQDGGMATLLAWEKLRVYYNVILLGLVFVLSSFSPHVGNPGFWLFVIHSGVAANLCFCVGPVAEFYLRWFGLPANGARWSLFVLGTVVAVALTYYHIQHFQITPKFDWS